MSEARLSHITPSGERSRRDEALRHVMESNGLDAMLVCGRGDEVARGRIQYVSDTFVWAGWALIVLPRVGDAVYIGDPLWGTDRAQAAGWIKEFRMAHDPGPEVASVLADLGLSSGSIGLVGAQIAMGAGELRSIESSLRDATLTDATPLFDDVRAVKSEVELANLRETSEILRKVFGALAAEIRPGVPERDVLAEAHRLVRQFGCLDGIATMSRPPFRYFGGGSDAVIERDDIIVIDLEWAGPSGYWVELRRCFSFGEPSPRAQRYWDLQRETFSACVEAIKPGVQASDVAAARDRVYAKWGYPASNSPRYTLHGIGIDTLETPWIPGNDALLRSGMVLSLHPHITIDDPAEQAAVGGITISDNVLVTPTGSERMTDREVEWVVL